MYQLPINCAVKHFDMCFSLSFESYLKTYNNVLKDNLVDSVGLPYYDYMNFQRLT